MGPGWLVEGALSVPGMRGRFGSEHGPVRGGVVVGLAPSVMRGQVVQWWMLEKVVGGD